MATWRNALNLRLQVERFRSPQPSLSRLGLTCVAIVEDAADRPGRDIGETRKIVDRAFFAGWPEASERGMDDNLWVRSVMANLSTVLFRHADGKLGANQSTSLFSSSRISRRALLRG